MLFNIGDYVTRKSYNNDTVFRIIDIDDNIAILKGVNVRLYADSELDDLNRVDDIDSYEKEDYNISTRLNKLINLDRNQYFYLPGKVLHIDGDEEYLERSMKFYKKLKIMSYGVNLSEADIPFEINKYLNDLKPDIVVITGHDAFYRRKGKNSNLANYKNSKNFIEAVKVARNYEKSHDKLIIIAGACQSNYEELIKAGANFASSPKRINLHALDPAIVAASIALSDKGKPIDLIGIIEKTKYKEEGVGGIITNGTMYTGYPR